MATAIRARIRKRPYMEKRRTHPLYSRCVAHYEQHLRVYAKRTSQDSAGNQLNQLHRFFAPLDPSELEPKDIEDYILHRRKKGVVDRTIRGELATFRSCLNRAKKAGLLESVVEIVPPKVPRRTNRRIFSRTDIQRILDCCTRDWVEGIIRVALASGLRNSEIRNLRFSDLDLETGECRITNKEDWTTKNRDERVIYLSGSILPWLVRWKTKTDSGEDDWVFRNRWGNRYTVQNVCKEVREVLQRAGCWKKNRGLHHIRHTVATAMLGNGVDLGVLSEWLGHADLSTTALYIHVQDEKKREAGMKVGLTD